MISVNVFPLVTELINTDSINPTKAGNVLGMNVKLVNGSQNFVGSITRLVPAVINYSKSLFTSMVVSGVTELGNELTFQISVEDLMNNSFNNGMYNEIYFTTNLEAMSNATISQQSVNSFVDQETVVEVFNTEYIVPGAIISFTQDSGATEVNALVLGLNANGSAVSVITVNDVGRPITQSITLVTATSPEFDGGILIADSTLVPPIEPPATTIVGSTIAGSSISDFSTLTAGGSFISDPNLTYRAGINSSNQFEFAVLDLGVSIGFAFDNTPQSVSITGDGTPTATISGNGVNVGGLVSGTYTLTVDEVTVQIYQVAGIIVRVVGCDTSLGDTFTGTFTYSGATPSVSDDFSDADVDASGALVVHRVANAGDEITVDFVAGDTRTVVATKSVDGGTSDTITSPNTTTFVLRESIEIDLTFSA